MPMTVLEIRKAALKLSGSERGRRVLVGLLATIQNGMDGLDSENQQAVFTLLTAQFGAFAGTTKDEIRSAIQFGIGK